MVGIQDTRRGPSLTGQMGGASFSGPNRADVATFETLKEALLAIVHIVQERPVEGTPETRPHDSPWEMQQGGPGGY